MPDLELRAARRAVIGRKVRGLRRAGLLPANLYGPGRNSTALQRRDLAGVASIIGLGTFALFDYLFVRSLLSF